MVQVTTGEHPWPDLPFAEWQDTCATLQMWTQIVGKVRLALEPMVNHWWQVPLYVTSTGLTTSPIPYESRSFQIDFDFCRHALTFVTSMPACAHLRHQRSTTSGVCARANARRAVLRQDNADLTQSRY